MKKLPTTTRTLRRFTALLAMLALTATSAAIAVDMQDKEGYLPTPASLQPPTQAEEAAMRQRLDDETVLGAARVDRQQDETEAMIALGFNPDDPIARTAFLAESQASPDGIGAVNAGDYMLDSAWGTGGLAPERYAGDNDGTYRGIKAARLSNGDVVVVGEVTFSGGVKQVGITRRGANGARIAWPNVDAQYSHFGAQYILYPNTNTSVPPIYRVHDVKVYGNSIYVLVTGNLSDPDTYAPNVLRFGTDGSGPTWWFAAYTPGSSVNDAVAMDIYNDKLVVLGRHSLGVTGGFWTVKWDIESSGDLADVTFGNFPAPGTYDRSEPVDIAFRRVGTLIPVGGNPGYYVLFSRKWSADAANEDFDPCLISVTGNHQPDTTFANPGGVRCMAFDQPDSSRKDKAVALTTNGWGGIGGDAHEGIEILASVARSVRNGIGMWELLDRANHPVFGADGLGQGRIVFGGCGPDGGEGCSPDAVFRASHTPTDLAISGGYMMVSGYRTSTLAGESSLLGVVHGHFGTVEQLASFSDGYGGAGRFNSLVVRDEAHVVGIGEAIDTTVPTSTARTQIMTGLSNDDTIFENGFD